jgi:hypothetical protein
VPDRPDTIGLAMLAGYKLLARCQHCGSHDYLDLATLCVGGHVKTSIFELAESLFCGRCGTRGRMQLTLLPP